MCKLDRLSHIPRLQMTVASLPLGILGCFMGVVDICPTFIYTMTSSNGNMSALLALCAGNSPVTGEFLSQRPVTRSVAVFFDLYLNKRLTKQSWCQWFEAPSCPLLRHCNENISEGAAHFIDGHCKFDAIYLLTNAVKWCISIQNVAYVWSSLFTIFELCDSKLRML